MVKAQEPVETRIFPTNQIIAPHRIEVTFQKTVHILFPSEVKYVATYLEDTLQGAEILGYSMQDTMDIEAVMNLDPDLIIISKIGRAHV